MIRLLSCFSTFYSQSYDTIRNQQSVVNVTRANLFVYECSFFNFGTSAVYFLNSIMNLVISDCLFNTCITKGDGGGIYFSCTGGSIVLNRICGYNCYSTSTEVSSGQLSYCRTGDNMINELHYVSCSKCPNSAGVGRYRPIMIFYGLQKVKNVNFSQNNCIRIPTFQTYYSSSFDQVSLTAINNAASDEQVLNLHGNRAAFIRLSNIINNVTPNRGVVSIWGSTILTIDSCVFNENSGILFYNGGGSIVVKNSFITLNGDLSFSSVSLSNTTKYMGSYSIDHYSTNMCYANNPIQHKLCISTHNLNIRSLKSYFHIVFLLGLLVQF